MCGETKETFMVHNPMLRISWRFERSMWVVNSKEGTCPYGSLNCIFNYDCFPPNTLAVIYSAEWRLFTIDVAFAYFASSSWFSCSNFSFSRHKSLRLSFNIRTATRMRFCFRLELIIPIRRWRSSASSSERSVYGFMAGIFDIWEQFRPLRQVGIFHSIRVRSSCHSTNFS